MTSRAGVPRAAFRLLVLFFCVASLAACVSTPPDRTGVEPSYRFADTTNTRLHRHVAPAAATHPSQSGFLLLTDGKESFVARLALIDLADKSVDLQYYIFEGDEAGAIVAEALLRAADRGVRVRVLLDDVGKQAKDVHLLALQAHPLVEVRLFNPVYTRTGIGRIAEGITRFGRVNRRMHNKLLVSDGLAMITGGRNIGSAYFSAAETDFQDIDLFGVGPIASEAQESFDTFWNFEQSYPLEMIANRSADAGAPEELRAALTRRVDTHADSLYARTARESLLAKQIAENRIQLEWAASRMLYDPPDKVTEPGTTKPRSYLGGRIADYIESPLSELLIMSAYFVPGTIGVEAFAALEANGVNVKVLTNSLAATDVAIVHAGYMKYRVPLLQHGVSLWEMKPWTTDSTLEIVGGSSKASLHAKTMVFDQRIVFIGTLNVDPRSLQQNTESGVVIASEAIASEVARLFELWTSPEYAYRVDLDVPAQDPLGRSGTVRWTASENGQEEVWHHEPKTSFWRRTAIRILRVVPLDSQI